MVVYGNVCVETDGTNLVVAGDVYVATDELAFWTDMVVYWDVCKETCCLAVR